MFSNRRVINKKKKLSVVGDSSIVKSGKLFFIELLFKFKIEMFRQR